MFVIAAVALSAAAGTAQILSWQYTGSMNQTRWVNNMAVLPNGKVLTAGGEDQNVEVLASAEIFDPATGQWTFTAPLKTARQRYTMTRIPDGRIVVIGGQTDGDNDSPTETGSIEIFDTTTNTWFDGGTLRTSRQNHTATLLEDSTILIVAGYTAQGEVSQDSTADSSSDPINYDLYSCKIYNPSNHTSRYVAPMHQNRYDHLATLLESGEVLVTGGRIGGTDGTYFSECEIYNPVNNTWRVIDPMAQSRIIGCLTTFSDGTSLASGGRNAYTSCAPGSEILDPVTETWSNTDPMKQPVSWSANILLPFDNYLTTGGFTDGDWTTTTNSVTTPTCEWYDRFDKVWYYVPQLNETRCKHAAVYLHQECNLSLPFDLVLVAGGLTGNNTFTNSCELLDIGSSALANYKADLNTAHTSAVPQRLDATANVSLAVLGNTASDPMVMFSLAKNENAKIEIVNSVGNVVEEAANALFSQGIHDITLNTSNFQAGVYFVRLEAVSGNALAKLLVVK